ncbi:MAG: adenylate/guanylate cyclase domain-containing protein, partial [Oceanidesulfovibrio sp.]
PAWLDMVLLVALPLAAAVLTFLTPTSNAVVALSAIVFPSLLAAAAYGVGVWLPMVGPSLGVVTASLASLTVLHTTEGRQKRFIRNAFSRYLSPAVIELLIRQPERMRLGGERRVLSILFSDIEKFTAIAEGLDPEQLTEFLNLYLSAMTDIILDEGGTLDKYEGDAIIAFWNAPLDQPDHAERCLRAAMRCQERLAAMRPALKERVGRDVRMRIGVNTGPAVVGNLGSDARFDYSMIGDAVNVASRLEGANKEFGTYTIVSEETVAASGQAFPIRTLAQVTVVGRSTPLLIHELMSEKAHASNRRELQDFDEGRELYCRGELEDALARFERHERTDPPSAAYAAQCRALLSGQGLPRGWCGNWDLKRK